MNWFDTSGLTSLAKTALKEAQKTIDKALDITDESGEEPEDDPALIKAKSISSGNTPQKDNSDFFASWGLTVSAESSKNPIKEQPVVTESPSKSNSQSIWGSFAGSFFDQQNTSENDSTIVRPPKAKSMNVIADGKYDSQDDLFSRSQLVMSDGADCLDRKKDDAVSKFEERRSSNLSHRLSLVSSRNSSDSVEVLSHSLKTTPDSETSVHTISNSSSAGQKQTSESVEILPDSLISPSSIECLGFDSYCSDKSTSSNLSGGDISDKKSTPLGEATEKVETADSVSLVADDDEDTMSYNSISECTAPTVLDTDEKPISPFQKPKTIDIQKKTSDKELIHLEHPIISQKIQLSENSSNDGSWSDRTLNADNDSVNLETVDDQKKEVDHDDALVEKLSDSSSFYNVNVSTDLLKSESSAFVNVEKQQCSAPSSNESSQKESIKERTSPISSDSKSDLVKIGSDRTSGHTSGDEVETATSSDIEIIPSPNGDNGFCRNSPGKCGFKPGKLDGSMSPNLVDLVLGKSLSTKIRGHTRELSEASVQSNTSDESQSSENERLMKRLCEMAEILDARESRLMEVSRNNAELIESNAHLKSQVETLTAKHDVGDINMITEDYTQRMSALEKKFQQAIREKDQLRKELDKLKTEATRKCSSELENGIKERDEVIAQLQEEGEKLARQELQHSNIIKKLRNKEKDNEQVIKSLRDKITELTAELDRLKRSMAAKEELEVSQIETVYRLTTANKKMETELIESRSAAEESAQRLEGARRSLEGARHELAELQRGAAEAERRRAAGEREGARAERAEREADRLRDELRQLRADRTKEEQRWIAREESLRREVIEAREASAAGGAGAGGAGAGGGGGGCAQCGEGAAAALLAQLAALQRSALERERAHTAAAASLRRLLEEAECACTKAREGERAAREECAEVRGRAARAEAAAAEARAQCGALGGQCAGAVQRQRQAEDELARKSEELEKVKSEILALQQRLGEVERQLDSERAALEAERKRNEILQEQMSARGDLSPSHTLASDSPSGSLWTSVEEAGRLSPPAMVGVPGGVSGGVSALGLEEALAAASRRDGSMRAMSSALAALRTERTALRAQLAHLHAQLHEHQSLQEQYDALLQMYGEKEEQMAELRLDLHDVTQLYKAQLDELVALKAHAQPQR